jgi:hypothetical protein
MSPDSRIPLRFRVTDGTQRWEEYIKPDSISRLDPSGNNFRIEGHNTANNAKVAVVYHLTDEDHGYMDFTPGIMCCGAEHPHYNEYCSLCGRKFRA